MLKCEERFLSFLDQSGDCWLWTGHTCSGYGVFWFEGKNWLAHRASYAMFVAPLARGILVLHVCDTKLCVRPEHLFTGTYQDNSSDMVLKGRAASGDRNASRKYPGLHVGSRNGRAKLSDQGVMEICRRYAGGETQTALASEFGVTQVAISRIVLRRAWKHITVEV